MAVLTRLPSMAIINGFKGVVDFYYWMGIPVARKWPRKIGPHRSLEVREQWSVFANAARLWRELTPAAQQPYVEMASGTIYTARDLFMRGYISGTLKFYTLPDNIQP